MTDKRHMIEITSVSEEMFDDIIDVRSPSEFAADHIPGAINCPVLSDAERAVVGTLYVQVSPFEARKRGAALVSRNIATHLEHSFCEKEKTWRPLVYCWRGGERSGAMQTVLRKIGWDAVQLKGGYKAYRSRVLEQLEELPPRFRYVVIGGPTGSGKTMLLNTLDKEGSQVLDLEDMAGHKGSVLGFDPVTPRQSQKAFDTKLAAKLSSFDPARPVFVEAESRRIGIVQLPENLHKGMKKGLLVIPDLPVAERVSYLLREYVWFRENPEKLKECLSGLKEIRGKETITKWFDLIDAGEWHSLIQDLLSVHYDPLYNSSSHREYTDEKSRFVLPVPHITAEEFEVLAKTLIEKFEKGTPP